jgi:hypothetical protein
MPNLNLIGAMTPVDVICGPGQAEIPQVEVATGDDVEKVTPP